MLKKPHFAHLRRTKKYFKVPFLGKKKQKNKQTIYSVDLYLYLKH